MTETAGPFRSLVFWLLALFRISDFGFPTWDFRFEICDGYHGISLRPFFAHNAPMMRAGTWLVLAAALGSSGCSPGPAVRANAMAGTAELAGYRSYAIRPGTVVYPGASAEQRAAIEQRIQDAVASELEARGLTPQPDGPDVIVTYTAGAQQRAAGDDGVRAPEGVDVRGPAGGGYDEPGAVRAREWPDGDADRQSRRRYTEGNLVIDLLDGTSRRLVWRATANLELASDRGARMIGQVVARAFERYPVARPPARDSE